MVERTIRCYLALAAIRSFGISLIGSTYVIFLLRHGLTIFEAQLVNLCFYVTLVLFEVPTGILADVFGRKASFVGSCFLYGASMVMYWRADSFWGFVGAEIVAAIGATLASGAFQAWVVDQMKHHGHAGEMGPVFAKEQSVSQLFLMAGSVVGGVAGAVEIGLPWLISGIVMCGAGVLAWRWMEEGYFLREEAPPGGHLASMQRTSRAACSLFRSNGAIRFVFGMSAVQFFAFQAPNMQWQPLFERAVDGPTGLGVLKAGINIAVLAGAVLSLRFLRLMGRERRAIVASQIGAGAGIVLTVLCGGMASMMGAFLAHEVFRGITKPIKDAYLNHHIPSRERATLLSFDSIAHHIGGAAGLLISGVIAWKVSFTATWIVSGIALVIGSMLLSRRDAS